MDRPEIFFARLEPGRTVAYEAMAPADYHAALLGLGYSPSAAEGLIGMFDHLAHDYADDPFADRLQTPTTLSEWLHQQTAFPAPAVRSTL